MQLVLSLTVSLSDNRPSYTYTNEKEREKVYVLVMLIGSFTATCARPRVSICVKTCGFLYMRACALFFLKEETQFACEARV